MLKIFKKNTKEDKDKSQAMAGKKTDKDSIAHVNSTESLNDKKNNIVKTDLMSYPNALIKLLVTEKSSNLATKENKYIFKVNLDTNKIEIKGAIKAIYGVTPIDVNVINIPRKQRRFGRNQGYKAGYRKAIVTLAKGDKIEGI